MSDDRACNCANAHVYTGFPLLKNYHFLIMNRAGEQSRYVSIYRISTGRRLHTLSELARM